MYDKINSFFGLLFLQLPSCTLHSLHCKSLPDLTLPCFSSPPSNILPAESQSLYPTEESSFSIAHMKNAPSGQCTLLRPIQSVSAIWNRSHLSSLSYQSIQMMYRSTQQMNLLNFCPLKIPSLYFHFFIDLALFFSK